jgi:hypothetical protein
MIQTPGLQAWRDVEKRLMLEPLPNEPKKPNEVKLQSPRQTGTIKKAKKPINLEEANLGWR